MPANGGLPPSHAASLCGPKVHLTKEDTPCTRFPTAGHQGSAGQDGRRPRPLGIADLRQWFIARAGGGREDALRPARERSLRRAIKGLVDRGEILASGNGGPGDPRRYTTVECFASATGETHTPRHRCRNVGCTVEDVEAWSIQMKLLFACALALASSTALARDVHCDRHIENGHTLQCPHVSGARLFSS
jgi:hypothetical protein